MYFIELFCEWRIKELQLSILGYVRQKITKVFFKAADFSMVIGYQSCLYASTMHDELELRSPISVVM